MTIQTAIAHIQGLAEGLPGIRQAPDFPPEQMNVFPFAVCYPAAGEFQAGPMGLMKGLHNLVVEIHVARKDLPRDVETALPFGEALAAAVMDDPTLGGTVDTVRADEGISYTFGALAWGGQETVGWRLTIPVKIQTVL